MPQSLLDSLDAMATHRSISRASLIVKIVENMLRIRDRGLVPDADGNTVWIQPPCEHYGKGPLCGVCGATFTPKPTVPDLGWEVTKECPKCGGVVATDKGQGKCTAPGCGWTGKVT
jgi:hypothetical protein